MDQSYQIPKIKSLIDEHFSLQWCRENIVVPLRLEPSLPPKKQVLTIALGNISYLGTIGNWIKKRIDSKGLDCIFIEIPSEEIQSILDEASLERKFNSEGIENYDFSDESVLNSLLDASEKEGIQDSSFGFDFDDNDEILINEEIDLSVEMLGNKIQQAAATILINSCKMNASDIHIEPHEKKIKIRLRRDGVLQNFVSIPKRAGSKLTACLKNMAKMDIAEKRASQDGKIRRTFEGNSLEFRCSTAPSKYGEKMVLRYLNTDNNILNLDTLISNEDIRLKFRNIINQANGIVIVSGPTGSGKSTTLASALREKDNGELNIVTAEDPIEYDLGGDIQQFPVMRAKGQTFAHLLRTFLRQDPDVILIGETRDPETAESSMDAAETGHLVFTTLHANSAASSLSRLLDMEVPPYKLTASLRGILAQRLLRKVCPSCSVKRPLTENEALFTGLRTGQTVRVASNLTANEKTQRKAEGILCNRCNGTGYKGRVGTYELLRITRSISNAIKRQLSTQEIEDIAVSEGMLTLHKYAAKLIEQQITTVSELMKISNDVHN
tara:strand:- start:159 stop:1817 length:1659 start_codon:yes stop_codon:yes gene_type:complete